MPRPTWLSPRSGALRAPQQSAERVVRRLCFGISSLLGAPGHPAAFGSPCVSSCLCLPVSVQHSFILPAASRCGSLPRPCAARSSTLCVSLRPTPLCTASVCRCMRVSGLALSTGVLLLKIIELAGHSLVPGFVAFLSFHSSLARSLHAATRHMRHQALPPGTPFGIDRSLLLLCLC